ncbi:MAG: diacylglycerol kinase family protein [Nannocystaceae bacterium]
MRDRDRVTLLVANPTARSGKAKRFIDDAMAVLDDAGLRPEFFATLPQGATVPALAERLEREDAARVVYMGGDGTFAEAAKAIILARERSGIDVPLGMLPMGTANDQGRSFGIVAGVRALRHNVEVIRAGVEQWLDVGRIEALDPDGEVLARDLWFDSCGMGFSARVLAKRNREREWVERVPLLRAVYRDKLVYTSATLRTLVFGALGGANFEAEIHIDGVGAHYDRVTDILLQGTIIYAGDWIFDPTAKPDDGKFEVVVLRGHADWAAAAIGGYKRNPVTGDDLEVLGLPRREVPRGQRIEVAITPPRRTRIHAQIDGEEFIIAPRYRVENLFHHLRIIVPENPHWV